MNASPLILVPLDGSEASRTALPAARQAADALDHGRIDVLHVSGDGPVSERALLDMLHIEQVDLHGGHPRQATGDVAAAIDRIATDDEAWLIVMSTQGSRAHRDGRLGRTTAAVIQRADCPVLVVRPDMSEPRRTLAQIARALVPLDGSPAAAAAVPVTTALGRHRVADLDLLHVATTGKNHPVETGTLLGPRYLDAPQHEWPAWAREFLRRFGPKPAVATGGRVRVHAARGDPADEIVRFAEEHDSDLIGIAWQQQLESGRADVVRRLLDASPCPLLFMPAGG